MNVWPDYWRLAGLLTFGRIVNVWPDYQRLVLSATALAARACFLPLYCLDRVVFCSVKGPQDPSGNSLGPSFFSVFLVLFAKSLFWGFCGEHGLNMDPTWGPRGLQNREKSIKKGIISWTLFLIDFLLILGASWVDFWWIFNAKLKAKLTKKSITWLLVGKLAEIAKKLKKT